MQLFANLPDDMINHVFEYDERYVIRVGKIIRRISKTDERYELLKMIPTKSEIIDRDTQTYYVFTHTSIIKPYERMDRVYEDKDYCICYIINNNTRSYDVETIGYDEKGNSYPVDIVSGEI